MTMTVRVSRDGGRTYGGEVAFPTDRSDKPLTPAASAAWPPCECPRCSSPITHHPTRKEMT
ncbi:hypothetical protein EF918_07015 [Streptomyces sp. WAC06614]|nr:hypothetical protein EF918_07015 [Streptomyces sp. WAC06614]